MASYFARVVLDCCGPLRLSKIEVTRQTGAFVLNGLETRRARCKRGLSLQYFNNSLESHWLEVKVWSAQVPSLLAHVGPEENQFVHLFGAHLLPPLHGQALLAHGHTLAAYAHGRHG